VELTAKVGALGTWANANPNITLTGTACNSIGMPWTEA